MEQEARRPLRSGETLTPEQTAYFNAVLDYVKECRPLLNQGQYHLPEPPQLADFDQNLQDYKKQIEAELEQEAATAGLTVEEYVAHQFFSGSVKCPCSSFSVSCTSFSRNRSIPASGFSG